MILSQIQVISQVHGEKGRVICNINKMNQAAVTPPGPRGFSWEFLVGVCRPVLQILTLFQMKKCHIFLHPFSDLGPVSRNMVKFNPGLSQISSTVFSSNNMQLEVTKNVEPVLRDTVMITKNVPLSNA